MPAADPAKLEAALATLEGRLARTRALEAAIEAATSSQAGALAERLETLEGLMNDADNALGVVFEEFAEALATEALEEARRLLRPLLSRVVALAQAGADGRQLGTLLDLAAGLDLKPEPDPEGEASRLAARVRKAQTEVDRVLGGLVEARARGRRYA